MRKPQLEAAPLEAARVASLKEIVLVGIQAVVAHTDAPMADFDDVVRLIRAFPDPHQQAVLLARLRISAEAMP